MINENSTQLHSPDLRFLSGNALKLIAAVCMLIDHIGFIFFPYDMTFRIIGRIALPIFSFMLAEGCRYTRNKTKHFLLLFALAVVCQVVYFIAEGSLFMSVLVAFSIATVCIYALQAAQKAFIEKKLVHGILFSLLFGGLVTGTYFLNQFVEIDGGFWGCMLPVMISLIDFKRIPALAKKEFLEQALRVLMLAIGLIFLSFWQRNNLPVQWYSLFSVILLLCYSGKKGKWKMKYFFYVFYPAHMALLYGISILIQIL